MIDYKAIIHSKVITASLGDSISKALSKLPSSHSAAFIFNEDKKLLGLVNPYYCLIKTSLPSNTKVDDCIFHPPKLYTTTPVEKIIASFINTKIHYLPLFGVNDKFLGVTSARKILERYSSSDIFNTPIKTILKRRQRPFIVVSEDELISHVLHLFRQFKVSKMVVVNKDNKIKGILSYFDLIHFLTSPKHQIIVREKEGNKASINNQTVKKFMKSFVITLTENDNVSTALDLCLKNKIGSAVIVNEKKEPINIITTHDFLNIILQSNNKFQINMHSVKGFISPFVQMFQQKIFEKNGFSALVSSKQKKIFIKLTR
jgi:predicted transcriptional regulator